MEREGRRGYIGISKQFSAREKESELELDNIPKTQYGVPENKTCSIFVTQAGLCYAQTEHAPICAQNCKIRPEVYVISPDKVPIKGKSYSSALSHGISTSISHWHTKPALLFHNIFLSVLRRIHVSDWDWGAMKTSAAILFAEDSRLSFQNKPGFTIKVKETVSAFLCWDGKKKLPHISIQVTLPALDSRELYFLSNMC